MTTPSQNEDTEQPDIINAYLESYRAIIVKLSKAITLPYNPRNVQIRDVTNETFIPVTEINRAEQATTTTDVIQIDLAYPPDITHTLQISIANSQPKVVLPRTILNATQYNYPGNDLGNSYTPYATTFRLWTPTASDVQLLLYENETGPFTRQLAMRRGEHGTWYLTVRENLENWYYLYQVTNYGQTSTAVDPYVKALAVNATRGMIVDLSKTNPEGWSADHPKELALPVDAIIYELHVRDFSIQQTSGMEHKGKYLAFTEEGTTGPDRVATGVDSLKELGITHVQVQPIAEFASIDETKPEQYNWGYDPRNYDVPEGAYATTPHGSARITECKKMVQSLHRADIGMILDVVYNHTFATQVSDFDKIVPHYYYRTDIAGNYTNGSGVGNELATERPMVQKFVCDSLKYWVQEYHIDGFRFDLMALLGIETMSKVSEELHEINPQILIYGEPWTGGTSALPDDQLLFKGGQKGAQIGVFNDNMRNGLLGSVFDAQAQGFASGAKSFNDTIKRGVEGSINDFTSTPEETINYVTSHDNMTLWDKLTSSSPDTSEEELIHMDMLAQAVIMTAQGVAFMQGGEEFLRTKDGSDNSYNAGDTINQFDWTRKAQYKQVFDYYTGLINLRRHHPAFRISKTSMVRRHLTFLESPENTIALQLRDYANGDTWKNILVCYNPNKGDSNLSLPEGNWIIVATRNQINEAGLGTVSATVTVKAISCMILCQEQ